MLSNDGYIRAIPELAAESANAELSHEAAVGRIAPEEIEYLMTALQTKLDDTQLVQNTALINGKLKHLKANVKDIAAAMEFLV